MQARKSFFYQQIYSELKDGIANGEQKAGDLLMPENQIAQKYGVDRSTVRKALKMLVDDGLVEKLPGKGTVILDPKALAASSEPRQQSYRNIGFLLPSGNAITQAFYATLFCVLERELKRFNFSLIYLTFDAQDSLSTVIAEYNLVGMFFVSNTAESQIGEAFKLGIPCAIVNSCDPRIPSILSDNDKGGYLAGKHLIENGHLHPIVLSGVRSYVCSAERIRGFRRAYAEIGVEIPEADILPGDSWEQEAGISAIRRYLAACSKPPTAIFALNDRLAFGAVQAIFQYGLHVPKDISVIGYDNLNTQMFIVPLASIEAHVDLIAESAAQALIWQLQGGRCLPVRISIPVELVPGETVKRREP